MALSSWFGRSLMIVSLTATWVGALDADDRIEVERWLDRMAQAVESLDYRGTVVHWRGDQFDTLKIIHRSDESGVRERLFSLSGDPREILRNGYEVKSLLGGEGRVLIQSQLSTRLLPSLPQKRLDLAEQAYEMHVRGEERVAGLQTQVIEILPRDEFRYGHRFWLEQDTAMLLRSALLGRGGQPIQQLSFVEIELDARIIDSELEPQIQAEIVVESRLAESTPAFENLTESDIDSTAPSSWVPPSVPVHFQLARQGQGTSESGAEFQHLLYSDGLASFSIYVEEDDEGRGGSRVESFGSVNVFTGRLSDRQVTIVGEVPMATVRLVGRWMHVDSEPPNSR